MLAKWPIRVKLLVGLGLLLLLVVILSSSGLYSTYAYRRLVKDISLRAVELPLAAQLNERVGELGMRFGELNGLRSATFPDDMPMRLRLVHKEFRAQLEEVAAALDDYRAQLDHKMQDGSPMADDQQEWATVHQLDAVLIRLKRCDAQADWVLDETAVEQVRQEMDRLRDLSAALPSYLHERLRGFASNVRNRYRALIVGVWIASLSAGLVFALFIRLFYQWIFEPLRTLIAGSRRVAGGQFAHRIRLRTHDEMAELAEAMNDMTARFRAIRDDLDRQVHERTKQVVRSEQLASVGFLAAGVAHEINNPLASVALCAESLEGRIAETLNPDDPQHQVIFQYLRMIQSEAFRCKGITEKLLDFSRIGQSRRQSADLGELVQGVIEMLGHLGKYQRKELRLEAEAPVIAPVNPQEIKQVVLNLLTNALDSVADGGAVRVIVSKREGDAEIAVVDNGCGMSGDVIDHVFEPFFTRRKEGQGTGLGLSISYRIVSDHGGAITAESPGPGQGATFRVRLPLVEKKEADHRYRAA